VIHVPRDTGLQLNRRPGRLQAGRRPPCCQPIEMSPVLRQ
jgi:hypothetical protein